MIIYNNNQMVFIIEEFSHEWVFCLYVMHLNVSFRARVCLCMLDVFLCESVFSHSLEFLTSAVIVMLYFTKGKRKKIYPN